MKWWAEFKQREAGQNILKAVLLFQNDRIRLQVQKGGGFYKFNLVVLDGDISSKRTC